MSLEAAKDQEERARQRLLERVVAEVRETGQTTGVYVLSDRVLQALRTVPRHCFVPSEQRDCAYADIPLPIGRGQTISQPFIVALMSELLAANAEDVVLEIGTGSGYQSAVLTVLARQIYSLERIPELANAATCRLQELGLHNISVRVGDGCLGWEEHAPFDRIIVTAAAGDVPEALLRQLKPGGRLVIPVGLPQRTQDLQVIDKDGQGQIQVRSVLPVVFVPLIGSF